MGYPMVVLPVLALFIDVAEAIVIVAAPNLFLNAKLVRSLREHRSSSPTLKPFIIGATIGAILGALALPFLSEVLLRVVLIVAIVVFLINRLRPQSVEIGDARAMQLAGPVGGVAGVFQGAAGISGPIVTPWFLSVVSQRDVYIFSIATTFAVTGLAQLIVFLLQGAFTWASFGVAAALIPIAIVIFPAGAIVRERISLVAFERIVLVLLACSAISLLVKLV